MFDLSSAQVDSLIFFLIGLVFLIIALFMKDRLRDLKKTGIKTEGIVFKTEKQERYFNNSDRAIYINDKITIRFTTEKGEWITGEIKQPFAFYFSGQYKAGEKVVVYYDDKSPSDFYVSSGQSATMARIVFALAGLIFVIVGVYKFFV